MENGDYPHDTPALVERLVGDGTLTRYQADRLVRNKVHGLVIDRYVILERLGEGAMGRVYKARHRLMGRLVALKVIAPQFASRTRSVSRFQRELRLIGRLSHPHIIRAYDASQVQAAFFLVMEYVGGQTLDRVFDARGPLPYAEVVDYAAQAALGLAHAHGHGIIHRDIKPSNLLLTDDGQIKLLDLGLGTLVNDEERTTFATAAGRAVGTIDFMSPEQASGEDVDGRCDLYSLGCTMYLLLTGTNPFLGDSNLIRLVKRIKEPPTPITTYRADLPEPLVRLLMDKLLARKPADRFQTGTEAAEALRAILPTSGLAADRPGRPEWVEPEPIVLDPPSTRSDSDESLSPPPPPHPPASRPSQVAALVHTAAAWVERFPGFALLILLVALLIVFGAGFGLGRL